MLFFLLSAQFSSQALLVLIRILLSYVAPLVMLLTWIEEVPDLNLAGHWLMSFFCGFHHSIMLNSRIVPYIQNPFHVHSFHFIINNDPVIWHYSLVTDVNNDGCVKKQGSWQLF